MLPITKWDGKKSGRYEESGCKNWPPRDSEVHYALQKLHGISRGRESVTAYDMLRRVRIKLTRKRSGQPAIEARRESELVNIDTAGVERDGSSEGSRRASHCTEKKV